VPETDAVSQRLGAYLGVPLASMRVLASGWETTIYELALRERTSRLPEVGPGAPLVLRFYEGSRADEKARRESLAIRILSEAGYPVPRPHLFEADPGPLGAPFLMMECVAGGPLFVTPNFPQAFKTFSLGFPAFVRTQVRLHRLRPPAVDVDRIPRAAGPSTCTAHAPLLDRLLGVTAEWIEQGPLPGLREGVARLKAQADRFRAAPEAIVHMDYHPQNVIVRNFRVTGVIDWVNIDRGDRHLCVATTAVILATSAMEHPRWMRDNPAGNALRALFTALYVPLYHALAPMELARFRYCQAVAAMARLAMFGMMRTRGPEAVGFRPEAITNVSPDVVRLLTRYAGRKAGVPMAIPASP
jgi:aminoglycoside phosphotransferase (APT) family kinase protein